MAFPGLPALVLLVAAQDAPAKARTEPPEVSLTPSQVKVAFHKLLDRPKVDDPEVRTGPTVIDEGTGFVTERFSFVSERRADGSPERVPVLLVRPGGTPKRRPAVVALHGTGGNKSAMGPWLDDLAKRGIVGVAIDARYHGDRSGGAKGSAAYVEAIIRAWRAKPGEPLEHPFYYDTCWDLWRTVDQLSRRDDIDPERIGMMGISMGGIETWLAASADDRVKVVVPAIAVQSFRWGLEHDAWQGRANTIKVASEAAARDLGEMQVNARVCKALWDKVIPGILDRFDGPSMVRLFAGRPLLILNGERDPNCPIAGARLAFEAAERAYREAGTPDRLKVMVAERVGHQVTDAQRQAALDWFTRWLKP